MDPRQQIPDVETGDGSNCRPASRAPEPSRAAKTAVVHASPGAKERQRERQTEEGSRRLLSKEETGSSEKTEKKEKEQEVSAGVSGGEQPCRTRLKRRSFA